MTECEPAFAAKDPGGREIGISAEAWAHVLADHPEMVDDLENMLLTISDPEFSRDDPRPGRRCYFRRTGPERWRRVVTEFDGPSDRVVTVFPQSNDPEGWES